MKFTWSAQAWDDYLFWQASDPDILAKINALLKDASQTSFSGLGKPEPLKHGLHGWWSRRITGEHRIVYRVEGKGNDRQIEIIQCRYHYAR